MRSGVNTPILGWEMEATKEIRWQLHWGSALSRLKRRRQGWIFFRRQNPSATRPQMTRRTSQGLSLGGSRKSRSTRPSPRSELSPDSAWEALRDWRAAGAPIRCATAAVNLFFSYAPAGSPPPFSLFAERGVGYISGIRSRFQRLPEFLSPGQPGLRNHLRGTSTRRAPSPERRTDLSMRNDGEETRLGRGKAGAGREA